MTQLLVALIAAPPVVWLVVLCIRDPLRVALPIFAALIPFGGLLSVGSSRFGSLSSLAGIVLGGGLVMQLVSGRRAAVRLHAALPVWLLFLAAAGATALWSVAPDTTINGFIVLSSLVLLYVFVSLSSVDRSVLERTENGLLVGGVAVTAYGLYQLLILGGFPSDAPGFAGPAPDGRFGNDLLGPNNEAVALLLPLVIALTRAVAGSRSGRRWTYVSISALLFLGILMTGSRGGLLAAFVAVLVLGLAVPRGRAALLAAGVAVAVVGAAVFQYTPAGIAERTGDPTSSSGRTSIWRVGLAACPQYCAAGAGWGTFPEVYADTQASVPGARVLVGPQGTYEPHNVWLLAVIELGLLGLALLAAGVMLSIRQAASLPASLRGPPLSALVGTIFAATFLSNLEFKFFWMALIMVALYRNFDDAEKARPGSVSELAAADPALPA